MRRKIKNEWLRALAQPATYLGIAMIAAIFIAVGLLIGANRSTAEKEAVREGDNLAHLFEQSVSRALKSADSTILMLRRNYQGNPASVDLRAWATDPELRNDLTFQFSIVGPDGIVKDSSFGKAAIGLTIAGQSHFRFHMNATDDRLYVSEPVVLRTSGKRSIMLTRRLTASGGVFNGVLSVSFDLDQLEKFYRTIDLGDGGIVFLMGLDGMIRAAGGNNATNLDVLGQKIGDARLLKAAAKTGAGSYWHRPRSPVVGPPVDNVAHLVSYRLVEGFPLIAAVGISESEVFRHANDNTRIYLAISGLISFAILIAIGFAAAREKKLISATREITRQAYHDELTGLANRSLFRGEIDCALVRLQQSGDGFNILMLDLDNFKSVNDSLGHAAGDDMIRQVAARLRRAVGAADVVARFGGDEFAVLQRQTGGRDSAIRLAGDLLEVVGRIYDLNGHQAIIETSIGIVVSPVDGEDTSQLLQDADLALYRAKSAGRNTYRLFEPDMKSEARKRFDLEIDLRQAIGRDEFEVYYQPLVETAGQRPCGAEALARWNHPLRGLVTPDCFIPIAESTGLIVQLGERILRRACADAVRWPPRIKLAVNLSPVQFRSGDIVDMVSTALSDSGLPSQRLELEITESVLLTKDDGNLAKLHRLKQLGVSISLDDFGTGYSSLSYLQTFPFDKIKIDRSFIAGMATRPDCAAIVCAVTGLARSLNVTTTAEGVETAEQFELLRAAGCNQVQGYLFGRPCRASAIDFGPAQMQNRSTAA